jgi:single-strand DNA-binding protein
MTDINNVTIVGRLTRDLNAGDQREFAYTPNGQARANISIAVNRSRKNGDQWIDEANYFNVTIWGKTAENLKPYLTKGKQLIVEGYLKQDRWQDKETGKTRDRVSIVANNVQLLGGRSDGGAQPSMGSPRFQQNQAPQNNYGNSVSEMPPYEDQNFGGMGDGAFPEDIPF